MTSRTIYKLTSADDTTKNGTVWGPGVEHAVNGELAHCINGLHVYTDPLIAVFMDPIHGQFGPTAHLWIGRAYDEWTENETKLCCRRVKTLRRIELPVLTIEQKMEGAIRLVLTLKNLPRQWRRWARGWLDGTDRTVKAADAARSAAAAAWPAAARSAADGGVTSRQLAHILHQIVDRKEDSE